GDELRLAPWPVTLPVAGDEIPLPGPVTSLPAGRSLVVSGKRARAELVHWGWALKLQPDDGSNAIPVAPHDVFQLLRPFTKVGGKAAWHVVTSDGVRGMLPAGENDLAPVPAPDDARLVLEVATIGQPSSDADQTDTLVLAKSLENAYEPGSLTIAANVAR